MKMTHVFADLGLPNSEQELVKAKLTVQIYQILRDRKITQIEAARLLGTAQAQMLAGLMRCRPVSVSVGKLMEFLTTLGQDVEVTVKPAARRRAGTCSSSCSRADPHPRSWSPQARDLEAVPRRHPGIRGVDAVRQPGAQDSRAAAPERAELRRCWRCLSHGDRVGVGGCDRLHQDRLPGLRRGFWRCFD